MTDTPEYFAELAKTGKLCTLRVVQRPAAGELDEDHRLAEPLVIAPGPITVYHRYPRPAQRAATRLLRQYGWTRPGTWGMDAGDCAIWSDVQRANKSVK